MKTIIFSNDFNFVRAFLKKAKAPLKFFILQDSSNGRFSEFLRSMRCEEIRSAEFFQERSRGYQSKYAEFIAELNDVNRSTQWWALNLTGKSTLSSDLCKQIFDFLVIKDLIKMGFSEDLLVISDDNLLAHQVFLWLNYPGIRVIKVIKSKISFAQLLMEFTPAAVIAVFLRTLFNKIYSGFLVSFKPSPNKKYWVIKTLISSQAFSVNGTYRDVYFGGFADYLKKDGRDCLVIANIAKPYCANLKKAQVLAETDGLDIVPVEYFLSYLGILKCLLVSVSRYFFVFRLKNRVLLEGVDQAYLVNRAIRRDLISARFFSNLLIYFAAVSLSKQVNVERLYYPFENRSWEKMIILAFRKYFSGASLIGYQHTPFTAKHTELCLGKSEKGFIPLPNKIITGGELARAWMERTGNFPGQILRTGCALRQEPGLEVQLRSRNGKKIRNILLILSSSQQDYFKTLVFIKEALDRDRFYVVHVRAHPEIPFDKALIARAQGEGLFEVVDAALNAELSWADLVIYSSPTTVAWQAVSSGIPVIYIDVNKFLDSDTLFNLSSLKWRVDEPVGLIPAIRTIDAIKEEDFIRLQKEAMGYAKEYFRRVLAEGLKVFTEPALSENAVKKIKSGINFAIIVPTKNRPREIRRLLENIEKQEFQPKQIIIVDGGGIPLDELLSGFKNLRIDYLRMPSSLTEARNQGIRLLTPDITHVGFLDDDIVFEPGCLKSMFAFWENSSDEVVGMGFNIINISPLEHLNFLKAAFFLTDRRPGAVLRSGYETFYSALKQDIRVDWLFGGAAVWRRAILEEFKFDEWYKGYAFMEDMDFSFRVSKKKSLIIASGAKVSHLHAPGERVHGYLFGKMQMINRFYFVKKNRELSLLVFFWASIGRALGNFLIAVLYRNKTFLYKFLGNAAGLSRILLWMIKGSRCSSNTEKNLCRR